MPCFLGVGVFFLMIILRVRQLKQKRILIVSEYVFPEQNTTGYYWSRIASNYSKDFEKVSVISPYHFIEGRENSCVNLTYHRFYFFKLKSNSTFARVFNQTSQLVGFIYQLIMHVKKDDVVFSGTNPPLLLLFIALLKPFRKFKWQLLVHDVVPENFVPAKVLRKESFVFRIVKRVFDHSYNKADQIITIGRDMKELVQKKIGQNKEVVFVPNWVEANQVLIKDRHLSKYIKKHNWQKKIVFQFFGNIGRLQGLENLLESIKLVKNKKAAFLFLGRGPLVEDLAQFIKNNPDLAIAYEGEVSVEDRSMALSSCDVALVTLESGMYGLGVPSKSYFSMAADKPLLVVADSNSEMGKVVIEHEIGWCCNPGSPQKLATLVDEICEEKLKKLTNSPRKVACDNFSEEISIAKLSEITQKLLDESVAK